MRSVYAALQASVKVTGVSEKASVDAVHAFFVHSGDIASIDLTPTYVCVVLV